MTRQLKAFGLRQICDNEEVVNKMKEDLTPKYMTAPEADIILACKEIMKDMKPEPRIVWVRGHQDRKTNKTYEELPDDAQLNLDMDDECDYERTQGIKHEVQPLKGSGAMLSINGTYVTTNFNENIQEAVMSRKHKTYFTERYGPKGLTNNGYDSIAWKYIGRARKRLSIKRISTTTKLLNNWLNVGHQKKHMKQVGNCPTCGDADETQMHMYQCNHAGAKKIRTHAFQQMREYLKQSGVASQIGNTFTDMCESI